MSALISATAVWIGLLFAKSQLTSWRTQEKAKRAAETAEKIVMSAFSIRDVFESVRHPFSSIPKAEVKNKTFDYERRLSLLQDNQSLFSELRLSQFKAKLLVFDTKVDAAISEIFAIRGEFIHALWMLSDYSSDPPTSKDDRDLVVEARKTAFARGDGSDAIRKRLDDAIAILETCLGPTVRLNEK